MYKDGLEMDLIQEGELPSFHFAIWKIKSENQRVFAISIYRPPYTPSNPITDVQFITEFAEWIPYITIQHKNTIVLGDFNFHVNYSMDVSANIFQDGCNWLRSVGGFSNSQTRQHRGSGLH